MGDEETLAEFELGFKIELRGSTWAAYAPQGSGVGYHSTETTGHWYAAGSREAAESQVRRWIRAQDTNWSDDE